MKTIKEMAEAEYPETMESRPLRVACIGAYLAGARATAELGSLTLAEASQYTMALALLRAETKEQDDKFKLVADTLLDASNTIAGLFNDEPTE